jgi:Dna[CI] antecedent, DciA
VSRPTRLRDLLDKWQPPASVAEIDPTSAVALSWADAVGPDIGRRTRPGRLRNGVLTVYTAGSTWSHQLSFLGPTILDALALHCPNAGVRQLRFVVATGRTKALLDGLAASARPGAGSGRSVVSLHRPTDADDSDDDAETLVRKLRGRQQALDRARADEGWTRCPRCFAWRPTALHAAAACAVCAHEERRVADGRIERVLTFAPWLGKLDVAADLPDAGGTAYARVRMRLLAKWEEQLAAAGARLRRNDLHGADRVIAWSYLMLRCGAPQAKIGRAVIVDVLSDAWADALIGAAPRERHLQPRSRNSETRTHAP